MIEINAVNLAVLGATIAEVAAIAGSCWGIVVTGTAGAAAIAEDPGQFKNVLVLASLPMTQTFYALIVLLMITTRVVPKLSTASPEMGLIPLFICIITAVAEFISAYYQGVVCAAGISLLPKTKGKILVPGMILAVYLELFGVLGMVFSILAMSLLGLI